MARSSWLWPFLIVISAFVVGIFTLLDVKSSLRPAVAFWFLLVCPGMAYVRLLRLNDSFAEWTLAIALSLAIDAIVAGALSYARVWSAPWALLFIIGITAIGVFFQFFLVVESGLNRGIGPAGSRPVHSSLVKLFMDLERRLTAGRLVGFILGSLALLTLLFLIWFRS